VDRCSRCEGNLPINLDATASLGGFATARSGSTDGVNTYLLYQNGDGVIHFLYQDDDSGWKGPSNNTVFDGADKPTKISCVTAAAMGNPNIPLASTHDISRCFFQSNKSVKQVQYDGTSWKSLGFVPIP
jgi:hypothetical protein